MVTLGPPVPPRAPDPFEIGGGYITYARYTYTYPTGQVYWSGMWYLNVPAPCDLWLSTAAWNTLRNRWPFFWGYYASQGVTLTRIEQIQYELQFGTLQGYDRRDYADGGVIPSPPFAPQDCLLVQLRTSDLSRRGRGRIYLSGFYAGMAPGGRINPILMPSVQTNLSNGVREVLYSVDSADCVGPIYRPCLPRKDQGPQWGPFVFEPLEILSARVDPVIRSQRGRQLDKTRHNVS